MTTPDRKRGRRPEVGRALAGRPLAVHPLLAGRAVELRLGELSAEPEEISRHAIYAACRTAARTSDVLRPVTGIADRRMVGPLARGLPVREVSSWWGAEALEREDILLGAAARPTRELEGFSRIRFAQLGAVACLATFRFTFSSRRTGVVADLSTTTSSVLATRPRGSSGKIY